MNKNANKITMIKPTIKGQKNVLGVQGAKAALAKTMNFGELARSQMTQIEDMQTQIKTNLRVLQQQASNQEVSTNKHNQVYRLDPQISANNEYNTLAYDILGNPFIGGRTKSEHGKRKLGSVSSKQGALSHMSSYRRKKEAREALEKFVMKEEQGGDHIAVNADIVA